VQNVTPARDHRSPVTLSLRGDIDMDNADDVITQGTQLLTGCGPDSPLVIDLATVTFMDSSGLSALVRLRRAAEANHRQLMLHAVPERISVLLRLCGLTAQFPTVD
jgi:anti-sigma B factor antagonist